MADDRDRKKVREHWLELSRKYEASDMTREEFCAQEKINVPTFDNWRGIFKKEGLAHDMPHRNRKARKVRRKKMDKQSKAFLPVVITQAAESQQAIEIKTSKGHVVSVPVAVCPTILKEVLKALGDL